MIIKNIEKIHGTEPKKLVEVDLAAKTVFLFGVYLFIEGLILMLFPDLLLNLFAIPGDNFWVRAVGWSLIALSFYYVNSARTNNTEFFWWTVIVRSTQFIVFLYFVFADFVNSVILLFSGFEFAMGIATFFALKKVSPKKH